MIGPKTLLASIALGALLVAASASVVGAQSNNQNGTKQNGINQNVVVSATPELDSLLLFGTGLVGVAGYAALRWRTRSR